VVFLWPSTGLIGLPSRAPVILRFTGPGIFCGKTSVCNATDHKSTALQSTPAQTKDIPRVGLLPGGEAEAGRRGEGARVRRALKRTETSLMDGVQIS
jgi:hypothetical protein